MKKTFLFAAMVLLHLAVLSQDRSAEAKKYFDQYLDSKKFGQMYFQALPTLAECEIVFKKDAAATYYKFVEQTKEKIRSEAQYAQREMYAEVRIETFTVKDIQDNKGNYPGGMQKILDRLLPGTVFYKVNMLRKKGAASGVAFNTFVYLNNRWVFFHKPWRAFPA